MINRIIKFGATWCGPCKVMDASLKEFSEKTEMLIEHYDVEQDSELTAQYGVRNVPATFFLEDETVVGRKIGAMTPSQINDYIEDLNKKE